MSCCCGSYFGRREELDVKGEVGSDIVMRRENGKTASWLTRRRNTRLKWNGRRCVVLEMEEI